MHPILPDQPNRRVRTRTHGGVGGGRCEAPPYPDTFQYFPLMIHFIGNHYHIRSDVLIFLNKRQKCFVFK